MRFIILVLALLFWSIPALAANIHWQQMTNGIPQSASIGAIDGFDDVIYASSSNGKIHKSTNNGNSWTEPNDKTGFNSSVSSIYVIDKQTVLAGTNSGCVYRSSDGGIIWTELIGQAQGLSMITSIEPGPEGTIYVVGFSGIIYFSENHGQSFSQFGQSIYPVRIWDIAVLNNGDILAATMGQGIYKYSGAVWEQIESTDGLDIHALELAPDGIVYAGCSGGDGFWKSIDLGDSWMEINEGAPQRVVYDLQFHSGNLFSATNWEVLSFDYSTDSWSLANEGMHDKNQINALYIDDEGYLYAASELRSIYRTVQSLDEQVNTIIMTIEPESEILVKPGAEYVYNIQVMANDAPIIDVTISVNDPIADSIATLNSDIEGKARYIGRAGDILGDFQLEFTGSKDGYSTSEKVLRLACVYSGPPSDKWIKADGYNVQKSIRSFYIRDNGEIFLGTGGQNIYRSDDDGFTWQLSSGGLTMPNSVSIFLEDSEGNMFAAADWDGVLMSNDQGRNWAPISSDVIDRAIDIALSEDGVLYALSSTGYVYMTSDNGENWDQLNSSDDFEENDVYRFHLASADDIYIFSRSYGFLHSTNSGTDWEQTGLDSMQLSLRSMENGPDGTLWACCQTHGLFRIPAGVTFWEEVNYFPDSLNINYLRFSPNGYVIAECGLQGLFISQDGINYTEYNEGFEGLSFYNFNDVRFTSKNVAYTGGFAQTVFRRTIEMPAADCNISVIDSLLFGKVDLGQGFQSKNLIITNNGQDNITISDLIITDNMNNSFSIENYNVPVAVPAGDSHTVSIGFVSTSKGIYNGVLTIYYEECDESTIYLNAETTDISVAEYLSSDNTITVYPNPTRNIAEVKISYANNMQFDQLSLYNTLGVKVLSKDITDLHVPDSNQGKGVTDDLTVMLNISGLPPGVYFIHLKNGSNSRTVPVVVGQ